MLLHHTKSHSFLTSSGMVSSASKALSFFRRSAVTQAQVQIPGPKAYPVIGSLPAILSDKDFDKQNIYRYFQKLFRTYGPIVKVEFPGQRPLVLIQRPEDVKAMYKLTEKNPVRGGMEALKKAKYSNPYFKMRGGIVVEDGTEWWRVRSKVQVPMMKQKNLCTYMREMEKITLDFIQKVSQHRDGEGEVTLDLLEELQSWALESVCFVSINQRVGSFDDKQDSNERLKEIRDVAVEYLDAIFTCETGSKLWKIYPTEQYSKLEKSLEFLRAVCDKVLHDTEKKLASRKDDLSHEDLNFMEHLLLSGEGLTHTDIVTFTMDIIPGATTTTSDNAAVILYLLAKNPDAQRKLQEELDSILGDGEGPISPKQLAQLSYTRAVLKEANRVMPPMFGPLRILQEDIQFREYALKKGWSVLFMNGLLGWEESVFPQAEKFIPERWLRSKPLGDIHPFTILPFSHGTRMCIGRRMAEQQIYILIARLFHRFNLEWRHPDMVRDYKVTFRPRGPLKFTLLER
ncbi:probable cytochrome P450 49a1 isoform X2 [Macrobrachium rosenbergii]|uniref:probable cytochrome P450 49a1 isoform X2 n=1 Tax=Macrobrachium rosenbergii TaxID=79674 RepID=UPI0034D5A63A